MTCSSFKMPRIFIFCQLYLHLSLPSLHFAALSTIYCKCTALSGKLRIMLKLPPLPPRMFKGFKTWQGYHKLGFKWGLFLLIWVVYVFIKSESLVFVWFSSKVKHAKAKKTDKKQNIDR